MVIIKVIPKVRIAVCVVDIARYKDTAERIGISIGMGVLGWLVALIHLLVFDRLYLGRGRLSRIAGIQAKAK